MEEHWEEYNPELGLSLGGHMIAGSSAGVMEHVAMFPVDTIKTHMQFQRSGPAPTTMQVFKDLTNAKGYSRMFRGVQAMFFGCIPAHALYFSIYEASKKALGTNDSEHHPIASAAVGATSVMLHDAIMTPMDFCKQRLQLGYYSGLFNCISTVFRTEGLRAFYVSYPTTLIMNVPFHGVVVATNESLKLFLKPTNNKSLEILSFFASGGIAGAFAAAVTNPLDVIKTRLQTQDLHITCSSIGNVEGSSALAANKYAKDRRPAAIRSNASPFSRFFGNTASSGMALQQKRIWNQSTISSTLYSLPSSHVTFAAGSNRVAHPVPESIRFTVYKGVLDAIKNIWKEEGLAGFTRGIKPRILVNAPSTAICWTTYEVMKNFLLEFDSLRSN